MDNWVGKKVVTQPPYNFVFLDVCNSLWNTDFAQGFGIGTAKVSGTDRAILGWKTVVENTPNNALWVNKLYTDLSNGFTLKAAIVNANSSQSLEQGSKSTTPTAAPVSDFWGDNLMTLHNVYLNIDGQQSTKWCK